MRGDTTPATLQQSTPFGGSLNTLSMKYRISETPLSDEKKYGYLAFVTDKTRERIMASGCGEMKMHIEHIKKAVGYIRKRREKSPSVQLGFDLGD